MAVSFHKILPWIDRVFRLESDSKLERARQRLLIAMQLIGYPVAVFFSIYFYVHLQFFYQPFLIVIVYTVIITTSLILFIYRRKFRLLAWSLVTAVIFLSVGIHIVQGGFYNSSGTLLYAMIAPAFATLGIGRRAGLFVLTLFIIIVIILQFFESEIVLLGPQNVPASHVLLLFTINMCATGFFILGSMILLVTETEAALKSADDLLLNILPSPIAKRLKNKVETIADHHDEATIIFADFVDFTKMTDGEDPKVVVGWLNDIFSEFDTLAEKHGLEKIKTIGDAYMAVSGIPNKTKRHAYNAIEFSIDILNLLEQRFNWKGEEIGMRIGINTGPVVAGVIGKHKFIYDLWGDAVNTASRMESYGYKNFIQVTESTYNELKEEYEFSDKGEIEIKGKGRMKTYILSNT